MKVLLSAFSCGATKTSEPGVAWRAVHRCLAQNHEVWVVIQKSHYEDDLTAYLTEHPLPGFHPVFLGLGPAASQLLRWKPLMTFYYHLWQQELMKVASELHRKVGFDLCHHVTFARYWSPSGVRHLGIPFIWGPVGAAESAPPAFVRELPWREQGFEVVRDQVRSLSHYVPSLRATARAATIAVGISRESCEAMRAFGARRVEQLSLALDDEELEALDRVPFPSTGAFRALCLGRLLHWKGFYLAIRAFALYARDHPDAELWIVGSGPYRQQLEKTAADMGIASRIRFWGGLSHAEAMAKWSQVHVLLHPALHEAFGNVCLEAMAAGRPVVCLDIGGPALQVTAETGFIAPAVDPEESVRAIASFLKRIDEDRSLLARMSARARLRVREKFTMRQTGAVMNAFYEEAVAAFQPATSPGDGLRG